MLVLVAGVVALLVVVASLLLLLLLLLLSSSFIVGLEADGTEELPFAEAAASLEGGTGLSSFGLATTLAAAAATGW